jgi:hypothetical protein
LDIKAGKGESLLSGGDVTFDIPITFLHADEGIIVRACSTLLRCNPKIIWAPLGVSIEDMKKWWPAWIRHSASWLQHVYRVWDRVPRIYERFLLDL